MRLRHFAILVVLCSLAAFAEREPVLKQVDVPHPYYWREMYIPQLTTGPSSVAWMPDSKSLVYSMAGSLWRQEVGSDTATELTAGPGYDYQPDVSPDGQWIVYTKYNADALELWAYNVRSKAAHPLTTTGAVNVEPRFSPDGTRIVFVSTQFNRRFHIFTAGFDAKEGTLVNIQRLTGENRSPLPRYYYSAFDHEISPTWSPDGTEIIFVSNRGHIYGTGGLWRMKAERGAFERGELREIRNEETTWKARPDWSRDGRRVVYASYSGRQWHQLWLLWSQGGDPLPLTFGEYDNVSPRWSPDARHIAFISNRSGNTSLWTVDVPGTGEQPVLAKTRQYLRPMGQVEITVRDSASASAPVAARLSVTGADGRSYAPDDAWMNADDGFDRSLQPFEAHYFHSSGKALVMVPAGKSEVFAMRGFQNAPQGRGVIVAAGNRQEFGIQLKSLDFPHGFPAGDYTGWSSMDVHVHMNYGGNYRNDPNHLLQQAAAEDLDVTHNLIVNKEQRYPDADYRNEAADSHDQKQHVVVGQEYHTSFWGHLGLLGADGIVLPGFAAYPGTAMASPYPMNVDITDLTKRGGGITGYVHPYDELPDPAQDAALSHELPADAALGKVGYMEILGFSDHKSDATIWYRLLNCGFHTPAAGGTDAMANFASLRGPVGMNRTYVWMNDAISWPRHPPGQGVIGDSRFYSVKNMSAVMQLDHLKAGLTFATNGPLLGFEINEALLGDELKLPAPGEAHFSLWLRSIVPVDHAQIVCNGKVAKDLPLTGDRMKLDAEGTLPLTQSGWCVFRAWADHAEYPVLDNYPYATTSPIYFTVAGQPTQSAEDARFFLQWIDRLIANADANRDYNMPWEKEHVMDVLRQARKVYEAQVK